MKNQFVAIPVGQGDSFYYRGQDTSVLVDGGRSVSMIANQLQVALSCEELDILICTHNDADHANGVLGLLESGLQCREVWLPGRWTERLKDLLTNPFDFHRELFEDWGRDGESIKKAGTLDKYGDILAIEDGKFEENYEEIRLDEELLGALESADAENDLFDRLIYRKLAPWPWIPYGDTGVRILFDAIEAAERIRRIALAAFHSGSRIRWFEYGRSQLDQHSAVTPLNCGEILKTRRTQASSLDYLALSKANRESLVFSVLPQGGLPGVVFSADSDFNFPFELPLNSNYIVTAPHHGSEANADAYERLGPVLESGIIVRSDGNYRSRPGKTFLQQLEDQRFCTLCRGGHAPKQTLRFEGDGSGWHASQGVHTCMCNKARRAVD